MKHYWALILLLLPVLALNTQGALIHGSVYDLELNTLSQAIIEVDTTPKQVMVSRNGSYEFIVAPGKYNIIAKHTNLELLTKEEITVKEEGSYVLDLILFPDLGLEEELLTETLVIEEYDEPSPIPTIAIIIILTLIIGVGIWYWKKKSPVETPKEEKKTKYDLKEILDFVKKEGGRTTQKELRKAIPYSEAKISLMIAELESQGKIKRIKKGRGNILILP